MEGISWEDRSCHNSAIFFTAPGLDTQLDTQLWPHSTWRNLQERRRETISKGLGWQNKGEWIQPGRRQVTLSQQLTPSPHLPAAKSQELSIQAWGAQKMRNRFWLRHNSHSYHLWGCGQAAVIPWSVSEPQCKAKYFSFPNHRISWVARDPPGSLIQLQTWQSVWLLHLLCCCYQRQFEICHTIWIILHLFLF